MNDAPTTYAIRVDGHLDDHWSVWLGELDLTRDDDGSTTITVSVADQAQLHGVLACLRDIGVVLTEVRTTSAPTAMIHAPVDSVLTALWRKRTLLHIAYGVKRMTTSRSRCRTRGATSRVHRRR